MKCEFPEAVEAALTQTAAIRNAPRFDHASEFQRTLRERVEAYFQKNNINPRDDWRMYLKTAIILIWAIASYVLLIFYAWAWWHYLLLIPSLGFALAAIGFNIQHDASHGGYSNSRLINKLGAMALDVIGGSSYFWVRKHNQAHHTYTNIVDHDDDINLGVLGRLAPHHKHLPIHRWQHLYLWVLYGFIAVRWHVYGDFRDIVKGTAAGRPTQRPRGWDHFIFWAGKVVFVTLAFGLPLLANSWWHVLLIYLGVAWVQGMTLSIVFQLAHAMEDADFPLPDANNRLNQCFAAHQVQTTVDFARNSWFWNWYVGGLNFQIEHHLFPRICHVHYPAIAPIVEQTCKEFGVRYTAHETFWQAVKSHYRWLKKLSRPPVSAA